ncbi:hypothetical protein QUA40_26980, partial [Microcoleus sp. Pol11C3]|uniref:hypothetical protein n=1 Tax=Microcoleus sp. Pol11C3 TaxID=3055390 RepID=UPI002FD70209
MVLIRQGQVATVSNNVPKTLNITNVDQTKNGSCQITGKGISINLQIPANSTKGADINGNPVKVTNSGKANLEVPGGGCISLLRMCHKRVKMKNLVKSSNKD